MIRRIVVEVYSPNGKHVLHRAQKTAPANSLFTGTAAAEAGMKEWLGKAYPDASCWRVLTIPDGKTRIVKFLWDWERPGSLQAALAVELKNLKALGGRHSEELLARCRTLAQERAEA